MPAIQGRTREQLRVSVGRNCNAVYVSDASGQAGDATSLIDDTLRGGDNAHNGKWILMTSGALDGEISRADDYDDSATDITVAPAMSGNITTGLTYEMWEEQYPPAVINDLLNQALIDATGRVFDPREAISLFADGKQLRFDLPSDFSMLSKVEYRSSVPADIIHEFGATFDETIDADFTQALDTEDFKTGSSSLKLTVAAGASANDLLTDSITSLDISGKTHIEMWIKSSVTVAAADLHILLDDTAGAGSPVDTLAIPALVADTWTYVRVALANPESDTAIISVGFRYTNDIGACVIWLDDLKAVHNDQAVWTEVPRRLWGIDKEAQDLVFTSGGRSFMGYNLMKLSGGNNPTLFTSDTSVTEVSDQYIIARATELALLQADDGSPAHSRRLARWAQRAEAERRNLPILENVRVAA